MSGEAAEEVWNWSLLGVNGIRQCCCCWFSKPVLLAVSIYKVSSRFSVSTKTQDHVQSSSFFFSSNLYQGRHEEEALLLGEDFDEEEEDEDERSWKR